MRIIAGLKLNDDTPHIEKLQLCMALAKGVLGLKPGELLNWAMVPWIR